MASLLSGVLTWFLASSLAKVLLGSGLVLATATFIGGAVEAALNYVSSAWSGMPSAILQILALGGLGQVLSIVGGAILAKSALLAASEIVGVAKAA